MLCLIYKFTPMINKLNSEQAAAATHIKGPLLIFAGAGSGKTRVITHRIQYLIEKGISASHIVAVTFTNRSAREMKSRIQKMIPKNKLRGITISTFHSFGNSVLRKEIHRIPGYRQPFSILSQEDTLSLLSDIYRKLKLNTEDIKNDGILFRISLCKNSGLSPEKYCEKEPFSIPQELFVEIFKRYQSSLVGTNSVDFDDLILLPEKILAGDADLLDKYRKRFQYFLIDEFQDTNPAQFKLLHLLVGNEKNICVVGDDDQSIYGWRGADINIILDFKKFFPNTKTVRLEKNYRSTGNILRAANSVILNNTKRTDKILIPTLPDGEKITYFRCDSDQSEAEIVAENIHNLIIHDRKKPGDFAILFRTNFQSRSFEQELRLRSIPSHVVGGYRFFDRKEVKDILAYLRVIANPKDEISLKRIINTPARGIGDGSLKKIYEYILNKNNTDHNMDLHTALVEILNQPNVVPGLKPASISSLNEFIDLLEKYRKDFFKTDRPSRVLKKMIDELNFKQEFMRGNSDEKSITARMLNLSELVNMLSYHEENLEGVPEDGILFDFLSRAAMLSADNEDEAPSGRVHLLTLHLAKGLEYPCVFLCGLEEGLFPSLRSLTESSEEKEAEQEERRLFYVGITRAMKKLFLSSAATRRKFGQTIDVEESRFLAEIPEDLLLVENENVDERRKNSLTELLTGLREMKIS